MNRTVVVETQAVTGGAGAAPTLATEGIDVSMAEGVQVILSAESTRTISSGTLNGYAYAPVAVSADGKPTTFRWMRFPALDLTPGTGARDWPSGDIVIAAGVQRLKWVQNTIAVSAGSTVNTTLIARKRR